VKLFLYYIGKPRDVHANAMAAEYVKRLARYCRCEMAEVNPARTDPWQRHSAAAKILMDASGQALDSAGFTGLIAKAEREGRDQVFLLGGAGGPPAAWRERADLRLSLSPMTFPHEFARVMLAEQLYRAFTSLRGHPYPK